MRATPRCGGAERSARPASRSVGSIASSSSLPRCPLRPKLSDDGLPPCLPTAPQSMQLFGPIASPNMHWPHVHHQASFGCTRLGFGTLGAPLKNFATFGLCTADASVSCLRAHGLRCAC
eukprot:2759943-Prymnesium_polylepis.1